MRHMSDETSLSISGLIVNSKRNPYVQKFRSDKRPPRRFQRKQGIFLMLRITVSKQNLNITAKFNSDHAGLTENEICLRFGGGFDD